MQYQWQRQKNDVQAIKSYEKQNKTKKDANLTVNQNPPIVEHENILHKYFLKALLWL